MKRGARLAALLVLFGVFSASASAAERLHQVRDAERRCSALAGTAIPASAFDLPTGGGSITEAVLISGDAPAYCRVRGAIAPAEANAPNIMYQVNLPSAWNRRTVQFGGGGTNGVLIEATGPFIGGGGAVPTALSRGYVTYGSDSGHQGQGVGFFANPQAFANYSHEAVKRSFDVTNAIVRRYYGRSARRNYHIGGSKGGQEAMQAAQRYYPDFDGVVSYFPAAQNQSLVLSWNRMWHHAFNTPGGALNTAEQALLQSAVLAACDAQDGAADGIVSNTARCLSTFNVASLRCANGADTGDTCLSDPQIAAITDAARTFTFAHPMPNGITTAGPWPVLYGGNLNLWLGNGTPGSQQAFFQSLFVREEAIRSTGIDRETWRRNVEALASVYDASNPDLDGFRRGGGKMLIVQGTTDLLVPPSMTDQYFRALTSRYGAANLQRFVRYYVIPGYGHGWGEFVAQWDALGALDAWVETGRAPQQPVVTDGGEQHRGRTRPLCEYPAWPKFTGAGSQNDAANYTCVTE